jgi:plastocyanin
MARRLLLVAAAAPIVVLALASAGGARTSAAVTPQTLTIKVDEAPPTGHNWEFLDYFPRSGVSVHNNDTLHFAFQTASLDGFHNVTLGTPSQSTDSISTANPPFGSDSGAGDGDPAGSQSFNGFFGTFPPAGSGASGACGDSTTPCTYDGTQDVNSGALFNGGPTDFYIKIQLTGGAPSSTMTVNYICTVHGPVMNGTFDIVPNATTPSTQADLDAAAGTQYAADTAAGQTAESAVGSAAVTTNADGTHTISLLAGTESADGHTQILEMLPNSVTIKPGDHVKWTSGTAHDPHTVSFPLGSAPGPTDPFPPLCDSATGPDTLPTAGPPTFGCTGPPGPPSGLEIGYQPAAIGGTSISSTSTLASSGVIDLGAYYGTVPTSYTFTFTAAGTFKYQCAIHDHMTGQVLAAVTVPATGARSAESAGSAWLLLLIPGGAVLLALGTLTARRRRPAH